MKVLIVNSSDHRGGAAKAAIRLFEALQSNGVDVKMLVHQKKTEEKNIVAPVSRPLQILQSRLDKYELKIRGIKPFSYFSIGRFGNDITRYKEFIEADIINIHWINRGFLSVQTLSAIFNSGKKIIWTLHDSWAFTGGCHLPYDCLKYQTHCSFCPQLSSHKEKDLSFTIFRNKLLAWNNTSPAIFTPSAWLANKASGSALLGKHAVQVFPNTLNTKTFKTGNQQEVRTLLGLPLNKKLILFGAVSATTDQNKGYDLLLQALKILENKYEDFAQTHALCIFGSTDKTDLPMETFALGNITAEETMADIYRAADLFVLPSKSENLPYTIMEALSCGTPAVAFHIGGIPELITHRQNGYLAKPYDTADLANGIYETLNNIKSDNTNISEAISLRYGYEPVARQWINFYTSEHSPDR